MNERENAFQALRRVERNPTRASTAVGLEVDDVADRAFALTVVRGVLRWRPKLDFLIEQLSKRNIESIDADVATLLRAALYQLLEMDAPAFAVVDEHVSIAARRFPKAKGFVNAVLRNATRGSLQGRVPTGKSAGSVSIRTGHPEWLLRRWIGHFGMERAVAIAEADQQISYPDLLVNTRRITMEDAESILRDRGIVAEPSPFAIPVFRLRESTAGLKEEIEKGLFHPMDEGSVVVAGLVRRGDRVLDLASAPGGKALAMELAGARVVGHDLSIARLAVQSRLQRRFSGVAPRLVAGDGVTPPFRSQFDTVLLDAPCSATGTLRKNPEVRARLAESDFDEYAGTQLALLRAAVPLAGGEIIYATCSLEPEENENLVARFLESEPYFERFDLSTRVPLPLAGAVRDGILFLTPDYGTDGFTAIGLRRRESRTSAPGGT